VFTAQPYNQRQNCAIWGRSKALAGLWMLLYHIKCHRFPVLGVWERDNYWTAEESSLQAMGE